MAVLALPEPVPPEEDAVTLREKEALAVRPLEVPVSVMGYWPGVALEEAEIVRVTLVVELLAEYNAEIGVTRAEFFPQISLTASGGRSIAPTTLLTSQTSIWTYGASLTQAIFEGGKPSANLHIAESEQRQALLTYTQTIQKPFGDVSDSLVDVQKYREGRIKDEEYVRDLAKWVRLANLRYDGGITNYLEVLDAQRSLFSEQLTLAQSRGNEFQSLVQLYRSLGGGWQQ